MTRAVLEQRCFHHERREAVCRCPQCRRSFCRECVTEHEDRLICAACLRESALTAKAPRTGGRRTMEFGMAVGGLLLAWAIFFGAAESLITITERSEHMAWQDR
jgi:hypothetical protein